MFVVLDLVYRLRHARAQTDSSLALCVPQNIHTSQLSTDPRFTQPRFMVGELFTLSERTGERDGQPRSLEDFQFDLENVLTFPQLVGKSAEERNAASVMLEILAITKNKTAEVATEVVIDASLLSGQRVLYAVLAANTAGRANVIVREDNTKNEAWAWARLRERFGRDLGAMSFTEVFHYSWPSENPFEDVRRKWVKKVSKLPQGSLSSQAIEQLTISGMSRHGQRELENHLRLRAPMAWQDIQTQFEKYLSTICRPQSPQPMDIGTATTSQRCQSCGNQTHKRSACWYTHETCRSCGKREHLAKVWQGRAQESRLLIQDRCMFKLRKGWSPERRDCSEPGKEVTKIAMDDSTERRKRFRT